MSGDLGPRVGHLLRVDNYLDIATLSMWMNNPRADVLIGMAEASLRGPGPKGSDEDLLEKLRALVSEARSYHAAGDFPAAMARLRVADSLVALRIVRLAEDQRHG